MIKTYRTHGAEWCLECAPGYQLYINSDTVKCLECPDGEHFDEDSGLCKTNECSCRNGIAAVRNGCVQHGMDSCSSCEAGHHPAYILLDNFSASLSSIFICKANICNCNNGSPTTGISCGHWNETGVHTGCSHCNTGFHLEPSDEHTV